MSTAELQQPILEGGIRSINFFNGRLLTARDLTREQVANRDVDKRLGQAIGDGIAFGFQVSTSTLPESTTAFPILTIAAGLAINRRGQTLKLEKKVDVGLVRQPNDSAGSGQPFNECVPLQTGTFTAGAGVYLLTVAPAETTEGLAATAGLERAIASCNTDTIVSALQFRLIQLNPPLTDAELDDENRLRNLVAYKCFGVDDLRSWVSDPFGMNVNQFGLLDSLRPNRLTECDVPLAVLYWTLSGGIKFIDMWSVRRRVAVAGPATFAPRIDDPFLSDGEAMILQFREHLAALPVPASERPTVKATEHFHYFPPMGLLPLNGVAGLSGFDYQKFFTGLKYRKPVFMEGAKLKPLLRMATSYPPVELASGEMMWLYWVRENMQAINNTTSDQPQPYMVFTNGHMPFQGEARYDLAHFDYSNYGARLVEGG